MNYLISWVNFVYVLLVCCNKWNKHYMYPIRPQCQSGNGITLYSNWFHSLRHKVEYESDLTILFSWLYYTKSNMFNIMKGFLSGLHRFVVCMIYNHTPSAANRCRLFGWHQHCTCDKDRNASVNPYSVTISMILFSVFYNKKKVKT